MEWLKVLTKEQAELIKKLRVTGYDFGDGKLCTGTWRWVAARFAEFYPDLRVCPGNQIEGIDLCNAAMQILGEELYGNGWN
jgi:hypothetical protein